MMHGAGRNSYRPASPEPTVFFVFPEPRIWLIGGGVEADRLPEAGTENVRSIFTPLVMVSEYTIRPSGIT